MHNKHYGPYILNFFGFPASAIESLITTLPRIELETCLCDLFTYDKLKGLQNVFEIMRVDSNVSKNVQIDLGNWGNWGNWKPAGSMAPT